MTTNLPWQISPDTKWTVWTRKRTEEGMAWYPVRWGMTLDAAYKRYLQLAADKGGQVLALPDGVTPEESWAKDGKPELPKERPEASHYSVWARGKNGNIEAQCIVEHLSHNEAMAVMQATADELPSCEVWVQAES